MNVRSKTRRLLALPVLEEWFKAVDPVTPPSFVTLDLDAKRAVTASPRGDLSAAVGEYILRDVSEKDAIAAGARSPLRAVGSRLDAFLRALGKKHRNATWERNPWLWAVTFERV